VRCLKIRIKAKDVQYVLSLTDLRQLQIIQLEILLELDRICKKHDIQYSLAYGSLLGAVRHKGFIPWDDDMDVFMFREDYNRFCEVCVDELDRARFYLQTHKNTHNYRWGYAKLRRNDTEYVRKGQEHLQYPSGVSIDVFPLDSVPDSRILRPFFHFACFLTRKILWSEAGKKCESSPVKRWIYQLLAKIPKEVVFRGLYDKLVNFCGDRETDQVRVITLPNPRFYAHLRAWYRDLQDYQFEGFWFPGPRDYDACLSYQYGDYMRLPPIEHRKGHHEALSYRLINVAKEDLSQQNNTITDTANASGDDIPN
jgi:lipopolysaccharide cholinephosphotransferase